MFGACVVTPLLLLLLLLQPSAAVHLQYQVEEYGGTPFMMMGCWAETTYPENDIDPDWFSQNLAQFVVEPHIPGESNATQRCVDACHGAQSSRIMYYTLFVCSCHSDWFLNMTDSYHRTEHADSTSCLQAGHVAEMTTAFCPKFKRENRRIQVGKSYYFPKKVHFTCAKGFERKSGSYTIFCQADGTWRGSPLICRRPCVNVLHNCRLLKRLNFCKKYKRQMQLLCRKTCLSCTPWKPAGDGTIDLPPPMMYVEE